MKIIQNTNLQLDVCIRATQNNSRKNYVPKMERRLSLLFPVPPKSVNTEYLTLKTLEFEKLENHIDSATDNEILECPTIGLNSGLSGLLPSL